MCKRIKKIGINTYKSLSIFIRWKKSNILIKRLLRVTKKPDFTSTIPFNCLKKSNFNNKDKLLLIRFLK